MKLKTETFGEIEVEEDKIITFKEEILGFEDYSRFTIVDGLEDDPFYWLQSVEEGELAFMLIDPFQFIKDYQVIISDSFKESIGIDEETEQEDIIVSTLVVVEDENKVRTNLKAPIIINSNTKEAGQFVLRDDYPTRYYLLDEKQAEKALG